MIEFILEGEPESLNVSLNSHWAVRSRRNKRLLDTVFALAWAAGWRKSMPKFTQVEVVILNWRGDKDNAIGGCKPVIDGLWRNDIIPGDNPKECRITYRLAKEGKGKAVKVILTNSK